jgi:hypothetical protein
MSRGRFAPPDPVALAAMQAAYQRALCHGTNGDELGFVDAAGVLRTIARSERGATSIDPLTKQRRKRPFERSRYCHQCGKTLTRHDRGKYCSNECELLAASIMRAQTEE